MLPFPDAIHKFVRLHEITDALNLGWMALDSLKGTHHGDYSVHCVWLCGCRMVVPG